MTDDRSGEAFDDDVSAPGWDAIHRAAEQATSPQNPLHWDTTASEGEGIYAVSAFRGDGFWLFVTLGFSELFAKASPDPAVSGRGYELTMRVPRTADEPPDWTLRLLLAIGRYVFGSKRSLRPGHRMQTSGPITGRPGTRLVATAFVDDPQLGQIDTPFGRVRFLTVVGITETELRRMRDGAVDSVIAELTRASPLLVTDTARANAPESTADADA